MRGKKLALFMGRVHPKKGCDLVIEAFAKVLAQRPDWHLVIAGPDQVGWQEALNHNAMQLGLASRVRHIEGDIRNSELLRATITDCEPDFVFHLAAQPLVRASYDDPVGTFDPVDGPEPVDRPEAVN